MDREKKHRYWDGERFRFPEYHEIETNKYFDTYRDLETNTHILNIISDDFTGLKDDEGKNIFERDVLQFGSHMESISEVKYLTKSAGFLVKDKFGDWKRLFDVLASTNAKVIGNIHENPELLKP